jgi:hypothetical protein
VAVVSPLYSGNSDLYLRLNGDTGNNYSNVQMKGTGASASSTGTSGDSFMSAGPSFGTGATNYIIQVMDYSATNKHKSLLTRGNNAGVAVAATVSRYASTSAVTSFTFFPGGGFTAGSTFRRLGVN